VDEAGKGNIVDGPKMVKITSCPPSQRTGHATDVDWKELAEDHAWTVLGVCQKEDELP
jgi:hypothetical protein